MEFDVLTDVSPNVVELFTCTKRLVELNEPIQCFFLGEVILDRTNDLTSEATAKFVRELHEIVSRIDSIMADELTAMDHTLLRELRKFCVSKLYNLRRDPYDKLSKYLKLIGAALLPFAILLDKSHDSSSCLKELFQMRVEAVRNWLRDARERFQTGRLIVRSSDRVLINKLIEGLERLKALSAALSERLIDELDGWRRLEPSVVLARRELRLGDVQELLSQGLGVNGNIQNYLSIFEQYLVREIECYKGLAEQRSVPSTLTAPSISCLIKEIERNMPENDSNFYAWTHRLYEYIRTVAVDSGFVADVAPAVKINSNSPFVDVIAPEAIYIHGDGKQIDASLWINSRLTEYKISSSKNLRMYMANLIAHELCPGHHEHFYRGKDTPLPSLGLFFHSIVGTEGWAVYAETFLQTISSELAMLTHYHRIRRFLPAVMYLARCVGPSYEKKWTQRLSELVPNIMDEFYRSGIGMSALHYCIGLVETEKVVRFLESSFGRKNAHERYMRSGLFSQEMSMTLSCIS